MFEGTFWGNLIFYRAKPWGLALKAWRRQSVPDGSEEFALWAREQDSAKGVATPRFSDPGCGQRKFYGLAAQAARGSQSSGAGMDPAGQGGLPLTRPAGEQSLVTRIPAWVVLRPWPVTPAAQTNFFQQPLMVITVIEAAIYL